MNKTLIKFFHVRVLFFSFERKSFCFLSSGSHTCVFSIDLPEYSTKEIMYERLNYAITNCSSIDGDGTFNEDPNQRTDEDSDE